MDRQYDVCIVGAGLIGLGVAVALVEARPGVSLLILDKEPDVAGHQSSHNSGVLHSGLYYRPGSLKARLCLEGSEALERFCEEAGIPLRRSGKLVVATRHRELEALDELELRGRRNGLTGLRRLNAGEIQDIEPAATGLEALHVPSAGVVDFPLAARKMASHLIEAGATLATGREVTGIDRRSSGIEVQTPHEAFSAKVLVNCAGLHSDSIARLAGLTPSVSIIPFRGEYYRLHERAASLVRALIYPVPDPRFPFLGVHFTRRIDGTVEVGPNAVLALGREQYRGVAPDWSEFRRVIANRGFRRLALRHWRSGMKELFTSRSTRLYARLARSLVPAITRGDLERGGAGIRAQAVDATGSLVDDFVIQRAGDSVHVLNAPSPGATASLAIGRHVASLL